LIQGKTLADASKIDLETRTQNANQPAIRIKLHVLHSRMLKRLATFVFGGNSPGAAKESPHFDQGARGNVERTIRRSVDSGCQLEKAKQSFFHGAIRLRRQAVEAAHFTRLAVDRQLRFEPIYLAENHIGGISCARSTEGNDYFKLRRHRPLGYPQERRFNGVFRRFFHNCGRSKIVGNTHYVAGSASESARREKIAAIDHDGNRRAEAGDQELA
jgi:hypothetical protein